MDITHGTPSPNPARLTSDMGPLKPCPQLVTFGRHHWRPVETCSLDDPLTYGRQQSMYSIMVGKQKGTYPTGIFLLY